LTRVIKNPSRSKEAHYKFEHWLAIKKLYKYSRRMCVAHDDPGNDSGHKYSKETPAILLSLIEQIDGIQIEAAHIMGGQRDDNVGQLSAVLLGNIQALSITVLILWVIFASWMVGRD
jgi:hypothetical protein